MKHFTFDSDMQELTQEKGLRAPSSGFLAPLKSKGSFSKKN